MLGRRCDESVVVLLGLNGHLLHLGEVRFITTVGPRMTCISRFTIMRCTQAVFLCRGRHFSRRIRRSITKIPLCDHTPFVWNRHHQFPVCSKMEQNMKHLERNPNPQKLTFLPVGTIESFLLMCGLIQCQLFVALHSISWSSNSPPYPLL